MARGRKADPIVAAHRQGNVRSGTYHTWDAMRHRVLNEGHVSYPHYGGSGVTIYEPWVRSFAAFVTYVGDRPPGTTLDRIDPEGNYEPGNVRWSTPKEQAANKRARKRRG